MTEEDSVTKNVVKPELRPLSSLKWPSIASAILLGSSLSDPLSRNDPKPLQRSELEALAQDSRMRALLLDPAMHKLLKRIDGMSHAADKESLLEAILDVHTGFSSTSQERRSQDRHMEQLQGLDLSQLPKLEEMAAIIEQAVKKDRAS